MNRNSWIILFATIVWFIASSGWYMCKIKDQCPDLISSLLSSLNNSNSPSFTNNSGPISFSWNSSDPIFNETYDSTMSDILSRMGDNDTLAIIGEYYNGEEGVELGAQRAEAVQKSAALYVDDNYIKTLSVINEYPPPGKIHPFNAVRFQIRSGMVTPESNTPELVSNEPEISKIPYKITIWFRERTAYKILSIDTESTIETFVDSLKRASSYRLDVVGHTDVGGTRDQNYLLGRQRAWAIKKLLMDKGLDPMRIHTDSRGDMQPLSYSTNYDLYSGDQRVEVMASIE